MNRCKGFFVALLASLAVSTGHVAKADMLYAWGSNGSGQIGDGSVTNRLSPVSVSSWTTNNVAIATGELHSLALLANGRVQASGTNAWGQLGDGTTTQRTTPVSVSGLSNVISIAGGGLHSLALISDGTVRAWGDNQWGELGDGTTTQRTTPVSVSGLSNVISIAAGAHS